MVLQVMQVGREAALTWDSGFCSCILGAAMVPLGVPQDGVPYQGLLESTGAYKMMYGGGYVRT